MTIINILMRVTIRDLYDGFLLQLFSIIICSDMMCKSSDDADVSNHNSNAHNLTMPSSLETICNPIYYQI